MEIEKAREQWCPYQYDNKGAGNEPLERCKTAMPRGWIKDCPHYSQRAECWAEYMNLKIAQSIMELQDGKEEDQDLMLPCDCNGHALSVRSFRAFSDCPPQLSLMMLTCYWNGSTFWERICLAWQLLTTGRAVCTDMLLSVDNANRLAEYIKQTIGTYQPEKKA